MKTTRLPEPPLREGGTRVIRPKAKPKLTANRSKAKKPAANKPAAAVTQTK